MYKDQRPFPTAAMAELRHNSGEVTVAEDFVWDGFQRCLQIIESAGPLNIPPSLRDEGSAEELRNLCRWVLDRDEYSAWLMSGHSEILRLVGSPGSGKTTVSEFVVEEIKRRMRKSSGTSLACFFSHGRNRFGDTPAAILRSLMCQLLLQNKELYRHIRNDFEENGEAQYAQNHLNDYSALWRNFRDMMQDEKGGLIFVVLDGLDWCREPLRLDLLRSFNDLLYSASMRRDAKLKLLVTYTRSHASMIDEPSDVRPALDLDRYMLDAGFVNRPKGLTEIFVETGDHDLCRTIPGVETTKKTARYLAMLELLIRRGAHVAGKDNWCRRSPLSLAAANGQESMVEFLIDKGVINIECRDKTGLTPLSWAAENGHSTIVKMLLSSGADVETRDTNGYTPLLRAAGNGHGTLVRFLLENKANVHSTSYSGQTPVLLAVQSGHLAITDLLLSIGAAADSAEDTYGQTPLSRAARHGYEAICDLLCERGVEIDSRDRHQQTPLLWAARNGHESVVRGLLRHGAFINARDSRYSQTSLTWACRNGHQNIVELLLGNRSEVDMTDNRGRTALSWAAGNGECPMVKLLLEHGADVNQRDQDGRNPLSWASGNGHADTVRQLLDYNADSSSVDRYGQSPFSWASENAYGKIARMLR